MSSEPMPDAVIELLRQPNPAVMATVAADGRPVSVATWYLFEDDALARVGPAARRVTWAA
jgi:Pyridoxamine 5'-phosphate oxidase